MSNKTGSLFGLLRNKTILAILDGDTSFGEIDDIRISMPYLSGPTLVGVSQMFGLDVSYGGSGGTQSRWAYLDDLIEYCIRKNKINELLSYLFSKQQFKETLRGNSPERVEELYEHIISIVHEQINGVLYFGGNKLAVANKRYHIIPIDSVVEIEAPTVKSIDREYIKGLLERAMQDVVDGNYDSAITKSRTLLEEVFCYVIERKGETPSDSGDIGKLYNQVKQLHNMHQDKGVDKRINMLLSGFEKIVSSIAQMRNEGSDSHGVGARRINIAEHHARLYVNSAMAMADFILSVSNNSKE